MKQLQKKIYENSKKKGWYDPGFVRSPLETHMLVVCELAEASEAVRKGMHPMVIDSETGKPEGERAELADAVIWILDYYEHRGWDLEADINLKHAFNATRPYRHGGKKL